ncbi:MAG: hypothetical protein WBQ71_26740, partial [Trebonia sp.]
MARDDNWAQVLRVGLPILDGARPSRMSGWVPIVPLSLPSCRRGRALGRGGRQRAPAEWAGAAGL